MVVSEQTGWLEGFQFSSEDGVLELQIAVPKDYDMTYFSVPFNMNRPERIALDSFRDKKVKITVEIIK